MPDGVVMNSPVLVLVTHEIAAREVPEIVVGHPDAALTVPLAILPALLDVAQRLACEARQMAWASCPKGLEHMQAETGRTGWRAYLSSETAHLIHVLEESGIARFEVSE